MHHACCAFTLPGIATSTLQESMSVARKAYPERVGQCSRCRHAKLHSVVGAGTAPHARGFGCRNKSVSRSSRNSGGHPRGGFEDVRKARLSKGRKRGSVDF